jgi:hypothetical protein
MRCVCGTMVSLVAEALLKEAFSSNLRLLQCHPPSNVDRLLELSWSLWICESSFSMNSVRAAKFPVPTFNSCILSFARTPLS